MSQQIKTNDWHWHQPAANDEDLPRNPVRNVLIAAAASLVLWVGIIFVAAVYVFRIWT